MKRTPYSQENAAFSGRAHLLARTELYPKIFKVPFENLSFEDTLLGYNERGEVLDGEMAVDRIVKVTAITKNLRQPIMFTVQERFRDKKFETYQDITFTEWNNKSNLPSELYKLTANIFLYGYYEEAAGTASFSDAMAVDVPITLIGICSGELPYTFKHNPRSDQRFVCLKFIDLWEYGSVIYWLKGHGGI